MIIILDGKYLIKITIYIIVNTELVRPKVVEPQRKKEEKQVEVHKKPKTQGNFMCQYSICI
jgi:hypothetical protein